MPRYPTHFLSAPVSRTSSGYFNPAYKLVEEKKEEKDEETEYPEQEVQENMETEIEEEMPSRSPSTASLPPTLEQIPTREDFLNYIHELRKQHAHQLGQIENQYYESNPEIRFQEFEEDMQNAVQETEDSEQIPPIDFEDDFRLRFGYLSDKAPFEEDYEADATIYSENFPELKQSPRPRVFDNYTQFTFRIQFHNRFLLKNEKN